MAGAVVIRIPPGLSEMSKTPFTFVVGMLVQPNNLGRKTFGWIRHWTVPTEDSSVKNDESRANKLVYVNFVGVGMVLRVIGEQCAPFAAADELTVLNGDGIAVRIQSYLLEEYHV